MAGWEVKSTEPLSTDWTVDKEQPQNAPPDKPMEWGEVGKHAYKNLGHSALGFARDMVQPFIHPVETAENIGRVGIGALQKAGIGPGDWDIKYADAVGKFFADRYGGMENFKKTLANDPVGFAGDISTLLSGGETALARAPGMMGKVGKVAGETSRMINPVTGPAKAVNKVAGGVVAPMLGELATHTGADSLLESAKQGYKGGSGQEKLLAHMTGEAPASEAADEAVKGVKGLRKQMMDAYRRDLAPIMQDPTILDFQKIDNAIDRAEDIKTYSGRSGMGPKQIINETANETREQMKAAIDHWRNLNPVEYHTVEGFDALKQTLGQMYRNTLANTPDRVVAGKIYNAVRDSISQQNPDYGKVMRKYQGDIDELDEIERELSLGEKATTGTTLRKLQSIIRNNASSAYKHRKELGERLVEGGADDLMPILAGQSLNPPFARGLGRLVPTAVGGGAAEAAMAGHHGLGPLAIAGGAMALSSPRLMGQMSNKAGMAARPFKYVPPDKAALSAFQAGQVTSPLDTLTQQGLGQKPQVPISE
jgi:hypothetical protein